MRDTVFTLPEGAGAGVVFPRSLDEPRHLLSALFDSSIVGVAICDRQLRYCAVNDALAKMNGIPAPAHLGKTIHAVMGSAAGKVQPVFERVFATGKPLSNFELTAQLPTRPRIGRWVEQYFPLKDRLGKVRQVGAVVLELTGSEELQAGVRRIMENLSRAASALRHGSGALRDSRSGAHQPAATDVLAGSINLLQHCLDEARAISILLRSTPSVAAGPSLNPGLRAAPRPNNGVATSAAEVEGDSRFVKALSSRENEVVALLAMGKTNKEIAGDLAISIRTVESHRARIMLKLDFHSLSDLVVYAIRHNFIAP